MPELPEVEALSVFLAEHAAGRRLTRIDVAAASALKTFDPPVGSLVGTEVVGAARHGKFLDVQLEGADGAAPHLIVHLARAGWLRWRPKVPEAPPRPGRGPLALRLHLSGDEGSDGPHPGIDLTEAGTRKSLAAYVVLDPADVPGIQRLGPDALRPPLTAADWGRLASGARTRLKGWITDQTVVAGIGNAYSDEILHMAKLSPFALAGSLDDAALERLAEAVVAVLTDAVARSVGQGAATLKAEKRSGMRVHARTGLPCPVCGDTVREVSYADSSFQYCPICQTGGRPLADRRLSRIVK